MKGSRGLEAAPTRALKQSQKTERRPDRPGRTAPWLGDGVSVWSECGLAIRVVRQGCPDTLLLTGWSDLESLQTKLRSDLWRGETQSPGDSSEETVADAITCGLAAAEPDEACGDVEDAVG